MYIERKKFDPLYLIVVTHFDGLETILLLEYMQKLLRDTIDTSK